MKLSINTGRIFIGCAAILATILPASSQQPQQQRTEKVEGYLSTPGKVEFNRPLAKVAYANLAWGR